MHTTSLTLLEAVAARPDAPEWGRFVRLYRPLLEGWAAQMPADFRFALKAPQRITHIKRLKDADELVAEFLAVAGVLKERLGPLLFQLPLYVRLIDSLQFAQYRLARLVYSLIKEVHWRSSRMKRV